MSSVCNLLSVGVGGNQQPLITAAQSLGFNVIGIGEDAVSTETGVAIPISTWDFPKIFRWILASDMPPIHGILFRSSGPALPTFNRLANWFKVSGPGNVLAECAYSKLILYENCSRLGILTIPTSLPNLIQHTTVTGSPVVIKPAIPVLGKKNVTLVGSPARFELAQKRAEKESLDGNAIVQPYIEGRDIGVLVMCYQGSCYWNFLYEEITTFVRGNVDMQGLRSVFRSTLSSLLLDQIDYAINQLTSTSSFTGFLIFSFRLTDDHAYLFELNIGLGGDGLVENLLKKCFPNVNFFELAVQLALGKLADSPGSQL